MKRLSILLLTALVALAISCQQSNSEEQKDKKACSEDRLEGQTLYLADGGWRLWPDTAAAWEDDEIYLPGEYVLGDLPVNMPTGGWEALSADKGIEVVLPSTVEEHYWGEFQWRDYTDPEYTYATNNDTAVKNGAYEGVSWWWKEIEIPESFEGKNVWLTIRGARLRAEVFLNGQLVGYNIINEVSFKCDLSQAMKPGEKNLLAIRITSPGGRYDWQDFRYTEWGGHRFQMSHGFGGVDRGMEISAHEKVYIEDFYIFNTENNGQIVANAEIKNTTEEAFKGEIRYWVSEKESGKEVLTDKLEIELAPGQLSKIEKTLTYADAKLWDMDNPHLYTCRASIVPADGSEYEESAERTFGFRWFEADGVGENAVLRLNGKRIRLISAISWGFWGYNGLFPTPELAEREVKAARAFGMNCIQFHRNVGKTEVLDAQDRIGLYRYMEPGGGLTAFGEEYTTGAANSPEKPVDDSGENGQAKTFAEKYMEHKIIQMVKDHRSHPSLLIYNIQNEISPDLQNPRVFHVLRKIHELDPSRVVMVKSGIPPINQAWMQPYSDEVLHDEGDGYSGMWDRHTVGGPGVWMDDMYTNPDTFTHNPLNDPYFEGPERKDWAKQEIITWGEMLGAAVTDNHALIVNEIEGGKGKSFDYNDHKEILDAYKEFLDKWDFRSAYPTAGDLFVDIGNKCYEFWGRTIETTRLSEENDFLVISGWESTAIENHSGLVDAYRNFKGDPDILKAHFAPLRPVVKLRKLVVPKGEKAMLDVFLLNESGENAGNKLKLTMKTPGGKSMELGYYDLPAFDADRFVYPGGRDILSPVLEEDGYYSFRLELANDASVYTEDKVLVLSPTVSEEKLPGSIALITEVKGLQDKLAPLTGNKIETHDPAKNYDLVIAAYESTLGSVYRFPEDIDFKKTDEDKLYRSVTYAGGRYLKYSFTGLKGSKAKVIIHFCSTDDDKPGSRVFDVRANGKAVIKNLDMYLAAGAPLTAFTKTINAPIEDGRVDIDMPRGSRGYFCAIEVIDDENHLRYNCGGDAYTDAEGNNWIKYRPSIMISEKLLEKVKNGETNLLVMLHGDASATVFGDYMDEKGVFECIGNMGQAWASWMGSWYFVREHALYEGMPVNTVMKSYYQTPVLDATGLLVDGSNIEIAAAYSRDHQRNIGAGSFTVSYGKGKIVVHTIAGLLAGLQDKQTGIHPVMAKRLFSNSLKYLKK